MRVILGCDPLLMPLTGIGHYTWQLGNGLKQHCDVQSLALFAHGKFFSEQLLDPVVTIDNNETGSSTNEKASLLAKIRMTLAASTYAVKVYQWLSPALMRFMLRHHGSYIFHSPNFSLPPFKGKKVVTIHDLSTLVLPQFHPPSRVEFVNNAIRDAAVKADHIITDSEFIKCEIIEHVNVAADKITAIHLGADPVYYPRTQAECDVALAEHQLVYGHYFLFVSTIEPRKNLVNLLQAYCLYREQCPDGNPLVLVGGKGWNSEDIHRTISILDAKGWVKYLGYVSQHKMPLLYCGARALLFPSIYEGFGLPVLEAMQSGTAVMTSMNSPMAEVALDCAVLVEPGDVAQMAEQITTMAQDDVLVNGLSAKGLIRAKDFSWHNVVNKTLEVYRGLATPTR